MEGLDDGTDDWIEDEADKVATEAIKALKISREQCHRAESGIPNWTGNDELDNGQGSSGGMKFGRPVAEIGRKKRPQFGDDKAETDANSGGVKGPGGSSWQSFFAGEGRDWREEGTSSANILSVMKKRNNLDIQLANEQRPEEPENELLLDLRTFIGFQCSVDGEATTQELLDFFKSKSVDQTALFKSLLWKLCDFMRRADGTGVWRLKSEFR